MKLTKHFEKFLEETVNLNKARYDTALAGIETITNFLRSNELLGECFVNTSPQGSIKQKTIIKPASHAHEFDVDLLFEMEFQPAWEAKDYLENIAQQFRLSDRYKALVDTRGKNRCVTIDYASDFHLDIVPTIRTAEGFQIMNKTTNQFELTDGDGYAQWFENQTVVTNGFLVESVRLMKYLRDIKGKYLAKSILLTTLLGSQITTEDVMDNFPDLPTTLVITVNRLNTYLQVNPRMPDIKNPVLPEESFTRHWNQEKYRVFRDEINDLAGAMTAAFNEGAEAESTSKWRKIFGNEFPIDTSTIFPLGDSSHAKPLPWPEMLTNTVQIDAYLYTKINGTRLRGINSDAFFGSGLSICYFAKTNVKAPFKVYWQVVNTGTHAQSKGGLRGEVFQGYQDGTKLHRWESSLYTGRHWIECFIVKDGYCVARKKFFINIKNPLF